MACPGIFVCNDGVVQTSIPWLPSVILRIRNATFCAIAFDYVDRLTIGLQWTFWFTFGAEGASWRVSCIRRTGILRHVMAELLAAPLIRDVPDFPKPGIMFKDITPVLEDPAAFQQVIDLLAEDAIAKGAEVIVGIESRGFVFGTPLALKCKLPFAMARKLGKLPYDRITEEYALEYGTNTVEMHVDAIKPGQKAYIVDDLLATGGTAGAARRLVERLGGEVVGFGCMIELSFLNGRETLLGMPVTALLEF